MSGGLHRARQAQVPVACRRQHATARRSHDQALLQQEWLDHVFDRVPLFGEGGCERIEAGGPTGIEFGETTQVAAVHGVEAALVHLQAAESRVGRRRVDRIGAVHRREIANPAQQADGDPRRAARASGDFERSVVAERKPENRRSAADDQPEVFGVVELQSERDAEALA